MRVRWLVCVLHAITAVLCTTTKYYNATTSTTAPSLTQISSNLTISTASLDCSGDAIPAECFSTTLPLTPISLSCAPTTYNADFTVSTRGFTDYCQYFDAYWANNEFYAYDDRCLASWCTASFASKLATETGPYTKYVTTILTFLPVSTTTLPGGDEIIEEGSTPVTSTATCMLRSCGWRRRPTDRCRGAGS